MGGIESFNFTYSPTDLRTGCKDEEDETSCDTEVNDGYKMG